MRSVRRVHVGVAACGLLLLTGCSSGHSKHAGSTVSGSPSPSSGTAAAALAAAANNAVTTAYSATYHFQTSSPSATGTIRVYRGTGAYRLDVSAKGSTAILVVNGTGSYACRTAGPKRVCFEVAAAHQPLPPLFDAGLQRVFTSYLTTLATHPEQYDVQAAGDMPAAHGAGEAHCYKVSAKSDAAAPQVATGTYCLAGDGLVTAVTYPSGSLTLTDRGAAPSAKTLQPLATPTPLPKA